MLRFDYSTEKKIAKGPAIFIDRDGVINCRRPDDYVLDLSQFVFVPGIRAALKQIASLGLPLIVISNQAAVGKGLLEPARLQEITERMRQILVEDGASLTAAYYCPHRQDEDCACRKPRPGLLRQAAVDFGVDLERSVFVGDSESDVQAARAVGVSPILFGSSLRNIGATERLSTASKAEELFDVVTRCLHQAALPTRRAPIAATP